MATIEARRAELVTDAGCWLLITRECSIRCVDTTQYATIEARSAELVANVGCLRKYCA